MCEIFHFRVFTNRLFAEKNNTENVMKRNETKTKTINTTNETQNDQSNKMLHVHCTNIYAQAYQTTFSCCYCSRLKSRFFRSCRKQLIQRSARGFYTYGSNKRERDSEAHSQWTSERTKQSVNCRKFTHIPICSKYGGYLMVFVTEFVTASWRTLKNGWIIE